MAIVTLKFTLPEEQEDMQIAMDAAKWRHIVWEIDQYCRATLKHGTSIVAPEETATKQEIEYCEIFREYLHDLMKLENLSFD